jgi:hypothetical protein
MGLCFFKIRNSLRKLNDLSKITELLNGEIVTYLGLLIPDLTFFYILEDLLVRCGGAFL